MTTNKEVKNMKAFANNATVQAAKALASMVNKPTKVVQFALAK